MIGHGTGSIRTLFEKAAAGQTGAAGVAAANPHNQTFAVGIQLGVLGIAVLWAMWIAHLAVSRQQQLAAWIGLVIVAQNMTVRCSIRTSSILCKDGPMSSGSEWPGEWCWHRKTEFICD